jgi:hypothetical protein
VSRDEGITDARDPQNKARRHRKDFAAMQAFEGCPVQLQLATDVSQAEITYPCRVFADDDVIAFAFFAIHADS